MAFRENCTNWFEFKVEARKPDKTKCDGSTLVLGRLFQFLRDQVTKIVCQPPSPIFLALVAVLGIAGCRHLGPEVVLADRLPYNEAIAATWQQQTLLNIVKLRYGDTPFFVDVPQITSGYTLQAGVSANGLISPPVNPAASFAQQLGASLGYQGAYQDRPTISYTPQTGAQFIRNLAHPLSPSGVLYLIQAGYAADVVFELTLESINGIKNHSTSGSGIRTADREFLQVIKTLRKAQLSGQVGMRIELDKAKKETVIFSIEDKNIDPSLVAELAEMRRLLRLSSNTGDYRVVYGATAAGPGELAMQTRPILRILTDLASYVNVPEIHLAEGRAPALPGQADVVENPPFTVLSGCKKPCDSFAAVPYRGHWFWIDDRDMRSKRTMTFLLVFLALADTSTKESLPLITIQAN